MYLFNTKEWIGIIKKQNYYEACDILSYYYFDI